MKYPNKDYIEHLRRKYPPGTRLQLSCMEDEFPVPPGSMGTVECIDDAGQIHVDWDCGRSLALIPGVDSFSRLPSPKEKAGDSRAYISRAAAGHAWLYASCPALCGNGAEFPTA